MSQVSLDIVKIVRTDNNLYTWTRQSRNGVVTTMADAPYKQKHSAITAAVRENPDIYRENLRDATGTKTVPLVSKVSLRLKSKLLSTAK